MRSTMNISLPSELREWVQTQVRDGGFSTASEFVRDLLRREREQAARQRVDERLLSAVSSKIAPMTDDDWSDIERAGKRRAAKVPRPVANPRKRA